MITLDALNERGAGYLPGHLGIVFDHVDDNELRASLDVRKALMAPNGFLHAGTVVTLADTSCGYGCASRPRQRPESCTVGHRADLRASFRRHSSPCPRPPSPSTAAVRACTSAPTR